MACEYFVNGTWVSELEFKEILNNGLLDNLINDGELSLEGFKTRDTGATDKTPQVITRTDIPAEKLADILSKEISSRTGYPLNMLEALELTEDKKDFKIPLWASPYAGKFESLLTSLVSNKVIKQKMLGNSYVLASEEGFRINENATKEDFAKLGVVFSENFDPKKGLQPMRVDVTTGKMLPAQVMIPFKFRDEKGNILDLKQFTYIDESGKTLLDTSKFPKKLLNIFGFRIPTQERNSMSAIEIVGFLPEISGDLILAPRDFTKQMGSDFDVDKLYTYMYNHYYKDGKLHTDFNSKKESIKTKIEDVKENIQALKKELKVTEEEDGIISRFIARENEEEENGLTGILESLGKRNKKEVVTELENALIDLSVLKRSYVAARQNKILDIHNRIMTSSNPDVVASIISLDSFGEFKDLAAQVNKVRVQQGLVPALTTTILSETYQRTKYINATAGKDGVGAFSLDSTFNATAQGKDLIYLKLSEEASDIILENPNVTAQELLELNDVVAKFGDIESKGDMSSEYTLRSQAIIKNAKAEKRELTQEEKDSLKFKSTIIRALQSSAVDNEKEQILDKLNINSKTFDTIRGLAILGFEEKDIVGLITQEIVWEYLDKLASAQSSLQGFTANAEQTIIEELQKKYDAEGRLNSLSAEEISRLSDISGEDLLDIIANKKLVPTAEKEKTSDDNLVQLLLLDKFRNIAEVGKTIKKLQSTINVESNGLPKSLLETSIKVDQTTRMPLDVFNAEKLLGEYKEGKLEKPTTINGFAVKYGAYFANSVFNKYFPYNTDGFNFVVTEVLEHAGKSGDFSVTKKAELMQEIMEGIKSYIFSSASTGLYTENANNERQRLFVDSATNQSLATVLSKLSNQNWFIQNSFLNKLTFDLSTDGKSPSRVNFEAAAGENFDERGTYLGFLYMLQNTSVVGEFNGITYTQRMLAQELIAAAYLEGGTQGAKQYLKYIPVNYLKTADFADFLSSVSFDFRNTFEGAIVGKNIIYTMPSRFTKQFLQNNPDLVKTINFEDIEGIVKDIPQTFTLSKKAIEDNIVKYLDPISGEESTTFTKFLSIYDSNSPGNFAVYEYNTNTNEYNKISTLTNKYGFTQYNFNGEALSVVEPETVTAAIPQTIPTMIAPANTSGPIINNNPIPTNIKDSLKLNSRLGNSLEVLNDLFNKLEESDFLSSLNRELISRIRELKLPNNFKLDLGTTTPAGSFNSATNILKLNIANHTDLNDLATTLTHELIHAVTSESLKAPEDSLNAEQVLAIKLLKATQAQYERHLISKEGKAGLDSFKKSYHTWRYNNGKISKKQLDYILKELKVEDDNIPLVDVGNTELRSKYYGAIKIEEFVTMALTDPGFQNILNNIQDENATVWQKFKDAILSLLNSLGFDVKEGSLLALAVDRSLNLIEANQRVIKGDEILATDRIIWGHPALGKTTARQEKDFLDFDSDFKPLVAKKLGLPEGQQNSIALNEWRKTGDAEQFNQAMREVWDIAKAQARQQNKMLLVSDMLFLKENSSDFDRIINIPSETFIKRAEGRGDDVASLKTWKNNINKALQGVAQNKIITTDKYLSELLPTQPTATNNQLFVTKVDQFTYTYDAEKNVVIHNSKSGDKVETNDRQINKVLVQYALANNFEQRTFNGSTYVAIADRILNVKNANEVSPETWEAPKTSTAKSNVQKISIYQQLNANPITVASKGLYAYYIDRNGSSNPGVKLQGVVVAVSNNGYKVKKADGTISNWINYKKTMSGGAVYNMFSDSILEDILPASNIQPVVSTPTTQAVDNKYELFPGVFANQGQTEALDKLTEFLQSDKKAFLLQGKGGTGKTTIIKKIVKDAQLRGKTILAVAPTHKAKKVLASSLDDKNIKSTTLAAALAIKLDETTGKFSPDEFARSRNKFPITQASLVIIDEASMISDALLDEIKTFLPANAKIIFMGDRAQLPPVGQEKDSAVFDTKNGYELTEKMRQAASSPIINIGTKVAENVETTGQIVPNPIEATDRVNSTDPISGSSVVWESSEDTALNAAVSDFKEANGNVNYTKVITFNNQNHPNAQSVKNLNAKIREKLYGAEAAKEQFIKGEILTAYDTFGGEIPIFFNSEDLVVENATAPTETTITATASSGQKGVRSKDFKFNVITLTLKNEDGSTLRNVPVIAESSKAEFAATVRELFKTDGQLAYALLAKVANLDYGYAITSHKAQGSTYTNVYVMEDNIMGPSNGGSIKAKNQSLYVAVSRPTTKLVMVSNKNTAAPKKFSVNNLTAADIERMQKPLDGTKEDFLPDNSWKTEDNNDICNPF